MECLICGRETKKIFKIEIDGNLLEVCESCKNYGKIVEIEKIPNIEKKGAKKIETFEEEKEIVENFGEIIKKEREKRKLSIQDFAKLLGIKESILSKIESGKLIPEDRIVDRIEKLLKIKLREGTISQKAEERKKEEKLRIADVVKIK